MVAQGSILPGLGRCRRSGRFRGRGVRQGARGWCRGCARGRNRLAPGRGSRCARGPPRGTPGVGVEPGIALATESIERPWIGALEATLFSGWVYDQLRPCGPCRLAFGALERSARRIRAGMRWRCPRCRLRRKATRLSSLGQDLRSAKDLHRVPFFHVVPGETSRLVVFRARPGKSLLSPRGRFVLGRASHSLGIHRGLDVGSHRRTGGTPNDRQGFHFSAVGNFPANGRTEAEGDFFRPLPPSPISPIAHR